MERIWAPWRMEYIDRPKNGDCIFCAQDHDKELYILKKTPLLKVMLNGYPYANGHLMVAPNRHTADLSSLSEEEMLELFRMVAFCREVLLRAGKPDGFNIGINLGKAAGAGVDDHLHIHVVPRWNGDNNFMTVLADTRVLPEALRTTYDRLLPYFKESAAPMKR